MVTSRYPEGIFDTRIYQPQVGKHPNATMAKYVGKPVRVVWQQPVFNRVVGPTPFHALVQWDGYVIEFDRLVPQDQLIRQPKLKSPPYENPPN